MTVISRHGAAPSLAVLRNHWLIADRFASVLIAIAGLAAGGASSTQPALRTTGAQGRREWAAT